MRVGSVLNETGVRVRRRRREQVPVEKRTLELGLPQHGAAGRNSTHELDYGCDSPWGQHGDPGLLWTKRKMTRQLAR